MGGRDCFIISAITVIATRLCLSLFVLHTVTVRLCSKCLTNPAAFVFQKSL